MHGTCQCFSEPGDPALDLSSAQEAWNLEIVGVVLLRFLDARMWRRHRSGRDCSGGRCALLHGGCLALVRRTFETTDRASLLERGRDDRDLHLAAHALVD